MHWIEQLDQLAAGKPCAAAKLIGGDELALEELLKIGADAIVPLLNWANTWADKPEFTPPHKVRKGEDCEYPKRQRAVPGLCRAADVCRGAAESRVSHSTVHSHSTRGKRLLVRPTAASDGRYLSMALCPTTPHGFCTAATKDIRNQSRTIRPTNYKSRNNSSAKRSQSAIRQLTRLCPIRSSPYLCASVVPNPPSALVTLRLAAFAVQLLPVTPPLAFGA